MKKLLTIFAAAALAASFAAAPMMAQSAPAADDFQSGGVFIVEIVGPAAETITGSMTIKGPMVKDRKAIMDWVNTAAAADVTYFGQMSNPFPFEVTRAVLAGPGTDFGTFVSALARGASEAAVWNFHVWNETAQAVQNHRADVLPGGSVIWLDGGFMPEEFPGFSKALAMSQYDAETLNGGSLTVKVEGSQFKEATLIGNSAEAASASNGCEAACLIACTLECRTLVGPGSEHTPEFLECMSPCLQRMEACQHICEENAAALDASHGAVGAASIIDYFGNPM